MVSQAETTTPTTTQVSQVSRPPTPPKSPSTIPPLRFTRLEAGTLLKRIHTTKNALYGIQAHLTYLHTNYAAPQESSSSPRTDPLLLTHLTLTTALKAVITLCHAQQHRPLFTILTRHVDRCIELGADFYGLEFEADQELDQNNTDVENMTKEEKNKVEVDSWVRYSNKERELRQRMRKYCDEELGPLLDKLSDAFQAVARSEDGEGSEEEELEVDGR